MHAPPASFRTTASVVVFVLCCLLSSIRLIVDSPLPTHLHVDDIAQRSDQRFAAIRAALPQRGVIGYVGDSGNLAVSDYYLAQYALAPLVVDHSPNHPLVVGNFPVSQPVVPSNLQLLKDFGNGVLLFASKDAE